MKTNFKDYLKKKNAQEVIDKFSKEYGNKKIMLYGTDFLTADLFRNYDLSKLNIIGIAASEFKYDLEGDYYGYRKFAPLDLLEEEFDLLLITTYDDLEAKEYLKKDLYQGEEYNFKIKTLIRMNLFEYIKALMNGDV